MLNSNNNRKLVRLTTVDRVRPIQGADAIELIDIGGWQVVVKKDDGFKPGSPVVYFEIDSVLPSDVKLFEFMEQRKYRVRTVKLRGEISQGLAFPVRDVLDIGSSALAELILRLSLKFPSFAARLAGAIDLDLDDHFRVQKYEDPSTANVGSNEVYGAWPPFLRKTDQERLQNMTRAVYRQLVMDREKFEITEKLEGQSLTFFLHPYDKDENGNPEFGICSRNMRLRVVSADDGSLTKSGQLAAEMGIREVLLDLYRRTGKFYAFQGERVGPGIQANYYQLPDYDWYCFDIYDINAHSYLNPEERTSIISRYQVQHVPVLISIDQEQFTTDRLTSINDMTAALLELADDVSRLNTAKKREGIVFKSYSDPNGMTFKVINNNYLLKSNL